MEKDLTFDIKDILIDNAKMQVNYLRGDGRKFGLGIEGMDDIADTLEGFIEYINGESDETTSSK